MSIRSRWPRPLLTSEAARFAHHLRDPHSHNHLRALPVAAVVEFIWNDPVTSQLIVLSAWEAFKGLFRRFRSKKTEKHEAKLISEAMKQVFAEPGPSHVWLYFNEARSVGAA